MTEETKLPGEDKPLSCPNCGYTWFTPFYECMNTACVLNEYMGDPQQLTPDSLPTKKECPPNLDGCGTVNYTCKMMCVACGMITEMSAAGVGSNAATGVERKSALAQDGTKTSTAMGSLSADATKALQKSYLKNWRKRRWLEIPRPDKPSTDKQKDGTVLRDYQSKKKD